MTTTHPRGRGRRGRRPTTPSAPGADGSVRAIAYARVSTTDQGQNGGSLDGQFSNLERLALERGWTIAARISDVASGGSLDRPGIAEALVRLAAGEAGVLCVSKVDRLARSVADFAGLTARAEAEGWSLFVADIGYDSTTPHGRLVANILSALGEWERAMIAARTSEGIAALKAQGRYGNVRVRPEVVDRIVAMVGLGLSFPKIAQTLQGEGIPSPSGKPWTRGTVWGVWNRWTLDHPQDESGGLPQNASAARNESGGR